MRGGVQLAAVREAAGAAGPDEARLAAMMDDEDFDPATYDAAMTSAFGGDYYDVRASSLRHPITSPPPLPPSLSLACATAGVSISP